MQKKKILVLGTGKAQKDLICYCRDHDFETFGCSYTENDYGQQYLDHFRMINITDTDGIAAYALESGVDYIYSVGSDMAMPTVSAVSCRLGLPAFMSASQVDRCCNKIRMRSALTETRWHVPFRRCSCIEEAEEYGIYPVLIKPADSQGQRGVFKVCCRDELPEYYAKARSHSRSGEVILEQYIEGNEVSVNAFLEDGRIIFSMITDRISYDRFPGGIIKEHRIPSMYEDDPVKERILALVLDVCRIFNITGGPVYFQIMIKDSRPYLIEFSPRLDGCHMWRLIKMYCGVDLLDMTINALVRMGTEKGRHTPGPPAVKAAAQGRLCTEFFCQEPGSRFDSASFSRLPALYKEMYYHDGDIVCRMNGYMEKCGYRIWAPGPGERSEPHDS